MTKKFQSAHFSHSGGGQETTFHLRVASDKIINHHSHASPTHLTNEHRFFFFYILIQ